MFDLNRDWAWLTQVESQHRLKVYNKWLPHIHVDFHEQGVDNPYYFAPAAEPYHEVITPFQRAFQVTMGKNHAKYFDKEGWFYFTKEIFDLFYPSYGDTYPTYNGSIGMTYEQDGSGRAGLGILTKIGDTLTEGEKLHYKGIPSFSPEHFRYINNADPMKSKQLYKGIDQLMDEGVAQLFTLEMNGRKVVGTVGALQFEVIQYRLEHEYGGKCSYENFQYSRPVG